MSDRWVQEYVLAALSDQANACGINRHSTQHAKAFWNSLSRSPLMHDRLGPRGTQFEKATGYEGKDPGRLQKARAVECVMNHLSKVIDIEDIEARVAELEPAAEAQKK